MARRKDAEKTACLCRNYYISIPGDAAEEIAQQVPAKHRWMLSDLTPDEAGWVYMETGCTEDSWGLFAPGHDARLAGMLQTAARLGLDATTRDGVAGDPVILAGGISEAFQAKVAHVPAPKPRKTKIQKTAEQQVPAKAKVGRWDREGYIDADGFFIYQAKDGGIHHVEPGKYSLVSAADAA